MTQTCQHCGQTYTLGVTGTVDGCDVCERITRNPLDHTIIGMEYTPSNLRAWVREQMADDDTLTDMEKA